MAWMILALVLAALAQSSLLPLWVPQGLRPDLVLVLVALCGGLLDWRRGLVVGLLGGLLLSGPSAAPLGVHLVRLGAVGAATGLLGSRFDRGGPLLPPALVATATLGAALIATLGLQAAGWMVSLTPTVVAELAAQAVLNGLLAIALVPVARRLLSRQELRRAEEIVS